MVDMALAYTPHPDSRERRMAPAVVGASGRAAAGGGGLGLMSVVALSVLSSAALLGPGGAIPAAGSVEAVAAAPITCQTRAFAPRSTAQEASAAPAAPVLIAGEPVARETRAESPLPFSGEALGPVPPPAAAPAPMPAREQHTLTSFDGNTTMTDGPAVQGSAPAAPTVIVVNHYYAEAPAARPSFPPPPVVWNHPVQWITVHKAGL